MTLREHIVQSLEAAEVEGKGAGRRKVVVAVVGLEWVTEEKERAAWSLEWGCRGETNVLGCSVDSNAGEGLRVRVRVSCDRP